MHKQGDDILLIRKYLNGELDAKAMHELERRAQDDPFLMDALDGYESAGGYLEEDIKDVTGRLGKRTAKRDVPVISMRWIGAAASVLIVCSAALWWFYNGGKTNGNRIAQTRVAARRSQAMPPVKFRGPTDTPTQIAAQPPRRAQLRPKASIYTPPVVLRDQNVKAGIQAPVANAQPKELPKADSTPMDEMIVMEYNARKKADTTHRLREAAIRRVDNPPAQLLPSRAPGVNVYSNDASQAAQSKAVEQGYIPLTKQLNGNLIEGRIISKDDGQPVAGASVKIAGTDRLTQTDAQGRFALKADTNHNDLLVTGIGYMSKRVSANNRDSVKNIALDSQSASLAEVVVTGYKSPADSGQTPGVATAPHPVEGWSNYRSYLKKSATIQGVKGIVKLSFMVDKFGSVTDIIITKSLNPEADKKAVDLVKYGPAWTGSSDKTPQKVHLRIRFTD